MAAAMLSLFNYRLFVVTPTNHFMRISDNGHIYTSVVLWSLYFTLCFIGMVDILPDQTEARKWALKRYSCAKSAMVVPKLTIFTLDKLKRIGLMAGGLCILGFIIGVSSVLLSFRYIKRRGNLSSKTKQMQKRFLIYLCVQVSVPLFSMIVPIGMLQYVFRTHSSTQRDLGNLACALVGSHGCIASLSLIMCNEPYRTFATKPLIRLWKWKPRSRQASREVTEFTLRSTQHQPS
ncbi:hypothetical protein V3C99_010581 [Haemonchus contortus]